jgi:glutathione S-transferase kappa 1
MWEVDFYFDVVSPYTFFAFLVFKRYCLKTNLWKDLKWNMKPSFLGGIMNQTGNSPPASLPQKIKWLSTDMKNSGEYFGVRYRRIY